MGIKLANGTHTRVPVSPPGEPRLETADDNGTTHNGHYFFWDGAQGLYKTRIPPPPADPPGEWVYLEFQPDEGYSEYQAHQYGSDIHTEAGKDYANES